MIIIGTWTLRGSTWGQFLLTQRFLLFLHVRSATTAKIPPCSNTRDDPSAGLRVSTYLYYSAANKTRNGNEDNRVLMPAFVSLQHAYHAPVQRDH